LARTTPSKSRPPDPLADTQRIFDALRRIVRDLRSGATRGLGTARLFVLQQIAAHAPIGVVDLATLTHTTPATVSGVVHHLVTDGLAQVAPDPDDRRRRLLSPTPQGRAALRRVAPAPQRRLSAAIETLSATERRTLARLLDKVAGPGAAPLFFEDR
jgi:DNA-binding MarR family transcriptional regulator